MKAYQNTVRRFQVVSLCPKQNLSQRRHYSTKYNNADALKVRILSEKGTASNNTANPMSIVPILSYSNADTQKLQILKENKGKSGVYRWVNKETGGSYVGSGTNLARRFYNYYSAASLIRHGCMVINRALLKYGYSNFTLEIIEYCEPSNVIAREQFYLDLLKPEYNILVKAGSSLGFKHAEETKQKIGEASQGRKHSEETKRKMGEAQIGRKHSEDTKEKNKKCPESWSIYRRSE